MTRTRSSIRRPLAAALLLGTLPGGCALLPEAGNAPAVPVPVSPADAADVVANARTRFVWEPVEGAIWYDFHVFDRSSGDIGRHRMDDLRASEVCAGGRCSVETSVSLPRMRDHAWRVRAVNRSGSSDWSRSRFAMVGAGGIAGAGDRAPGVPRVAGPIGATLRSGEPATFEWEAVDGAVGYDFHLFDATSGDLVDDVRGLRPDDVCDASGRCALDLAPVLPPASNHAWRVRATNGHGASGWTRTLLAVVP